MAYTDTRRLENEAFAMQVMPHVTAPSTQISRYSQSTAPGGMLARATPAVA